MGGGFLLTETIAAKRFAGNSISLFRLSLRDGLPRACSPGSDRRNVLGAGTTQNIAGHSKCSIMPTKPEPL
jgi:hypothetical protein